MLLPGTYYKQSVWEVFGFVLSNALLLINVKKYLLAQFLTCKQSVKQ